MVRDSGQPSRLGTGAGRIVERLGCCRGDRGGRRRLRERHRRLGADTRGLLRNSGAQDDMGSDPARRRLAPGAQPRHGRTHGQRRPGARGGYGAARARLPSRREPSSSRRQTPYRLRPGHQGSAGPDASRHGLGGRGPRPPGVERRDSGSRDLGRLRGLDRQPATRRPVPRQDRSGRARENSNRA